MPAQTSKICLLQFLLNAATFAVATPSLTAPNLTLFSNNSLFDFWRPISHFIAPNSWMNDPMGLYYDSGAKKYHASYQSHPHHIQWGNISQASATSEDLITWVDIKKGEGWGDYLTMAPSKPWDSLGVFDGYVIEKGYQGYPTIIYTGVQHLPLSWDIPYVPGTETQSLAYTTDSGQSWIKLPSSVNPILSAPPPGYANTSNLTGWRDPYVFQNSKLDNLLGREQDSYYLTIASGLKHEGPRLLLYTLNSSDWTQTPNFVSPIFSPPANSSWSNTNQSNWSGNWGFNFETSSVIELGDQTFLTMGTEGARTTHGQHWPVWVAGDFMGTDDGKVTLVPDYAGVIDWGETYAFISFLDASDRRIQFGWIYEDDNSYAMLSRGWQGAFTYPRVLFLKNTTNVIATDEVLNEKGSWGVVRSKLEARSESTVTIQTLGQQLLPELEEVIIKAGGSDSWSEPSKTFNSNESSTYLPFSNQPAGRHFYINATITFPIDSNPSAGFFIYQSSTDRANSSESTLIYFDSENEKIVVDRNSSSLVEPFNHDVDYGRFRLWNISDGNGGTKKEDLNLKIIADESIVEIYANDVFCLTTRVYPWLSHSVNIGYFYSPSNDTGTNSQVTFNSVKVVPHLFKAWPERPLNTSNNLVWDGPNETYWAGI